MEQCSYCSLAHIILLQYNWIIPIFVYEAISRRDCPREIYMAFTEPLTRNSDVDVYIGPWLTTPRRFYSVVVFSDCLDHP